MEGLSRGLLPPLTQHNKRYGVDAVRQYRDEAGVPLLSMIVYGAGTDSPGYTLDREFFVDPEIQDLVSHIYIPTDEEYERWSEEDLDPSEEIAKIEAAQ